VDPRPGGGPAGPARAGYRPGRVLAARPRLPHRRPLRTAADIDALDDDDFRKNNPRFTGENFQRNLRLADQVRAVADEVGATPAQIALAWLLTRGEDIVPIPGTKRVSRVEENTAAVGLELTAEQVAVLDRLTPAEGGHHNDAQMQMIER
jgi:aryl-alcohol dehydrogenase-like predicted oxidoreductase